MAGSSAAAVLRYLRRLVEEPAAGDDADRQLLQRFAVHRDADALTALLHRHGPMVLGVCRRVLADEHDAEDAFQATFLVLLRKASTVERRGSLAGWLYTVAQRTALKMRASAARRRQHERQAQQMRTDTPPGPEPADDLRQLLDTELSRLPEKYRSPVVLCYLQGLTNSQAARQLGWPEGTVKGRLARARALLARRLTRRGITLSTAGLAALLAPQATAALPASLMNATLQGLLAAGPAGRLSATVVALADTVLRQMALVRVKIAALVFLTLALFGISSGLAFHQGRAPKPESGTSAPEAGPPRAAPAHVDALGDPLPPGAVARLGSERFRHAGPIYSLAFTPDGQSLVSGGIDGTVRIWEAGNGKELRRLPVDRGWVCSVAVSRDGKRLAGAARDLIVWDLTSGKPLLRAPGANGVSSIDFSPDGKLLAAAEGDGTFRLWDLATGKAVLTLREEKTFIPRVRFSPDGRLLATTAVGPKGGSIGLWSVATGKRVWSLSGHRRFVAGLAFSPDSKTLASAGGDPVIRLWDVATGREVRRLRGHITRVLDVRFAPDGKTLASVSGDGTARIWDVATGKQAHCFQQAFAGERGDVNAVAFAPGGKVLAVGSDYNRIRRWDLATGREVPPPPGQEGSVGSLAFAPDGKTLVSASYNGVKNSSVNLWEVAAGKQLRQLKSGGEVVSSVAFSLDGKTVAAGCGQNVYLWNATSGTEVGRIPTPGGQIGFLGTSLLLATDRERQTQVWQVASRKRLHEFGRSVHALAPDGTAVSVRATKLLLWWPATGQERLWIDLPVPPAPRPKDPITKVSVTQHIEVPCAAFAPDGQTLAAIVRVYLTRSGDGPGGIVQEYTETIHFWEVATGKEIGRILPPTTNREQRHRITCLAFSRDGRTLAAGGRIDKGGDVPDALVLFWDTVSRKEVFRLHVPRMLDTLTVAALAFSPDGKVIATGGTDTTILLWQLPPEVTGAGRSRKALTALEMKKKLWADLGGADAAVAHRAGWALSDAGGQAVAFLEEKMRLAKEDPWQRRLAQLIADLDSDTFAVREAASKELARLGSSVVPALRETLTGNPSPEVRHRIRALLKNANPKAAFVIGGEPLRAVRAVAVLFRIGTPEARKLLRELAGGATSTPATRAAQAALRQLDLRVP